MHLNITRKVFVCWIRH